MTDQLLKDEVLRAVAATLNQAPDTASRTPRMAAMIADVNARIAAEALRRMPFDSTPYGYPAWLAETERS
ncbi:MAG: hypothetical protein EOO24_52475 [Comamonadaceae bacterium]|nr:MAG: hypothetical protein EOO24_52475 [Comamonadaceae bacterium]